MDEFLVEEGSLERCPHFSKGDGDLWMTSL